MPTRPTERNTQTSIKPKQPKIRAIVSQPIQRLRTLRARRPHKSFQLTRRRDIPRPTPLPGYVSFAVSTAREVWRFRRTFAILLVLYVCAAFVLIGLSQQDQYRSVTDAVGEANAQGGGNVVDTATQLVGLLGASVTGAFNASLTDIQQFYLVGLYVMLWLVIVWLLRQLLAGNRVRVRDGLYNAGAPLIASLCVFALMLVQALPGALGILVFSIATQDGTLQGGVAAMCFGVVAVLLLVLSLYWLASSFLALIIATLPGTYPMKAIRGASELALGRRTQLLLRLLWLVLLLLIVWAVILTPAILLDLWIKVSWLPIVSVAMQLAVGISFVYGVSYVFLLYRGMIDGKQAH